MFALMGPISVSPGSDYRCELILSSTPAPKTKEEKLLQGRMYLSRNKQLPKNDDGEAYYRQEKTRQQSRKSEYQTLQTMVAGREGGHVSLSHRLQAAGLAQAELLSENRRKAKTNDLIIDMHTNKVMGKQAMITETRELVQLLMVDDPMRPAQIQRLLDLNEELRDALNGLEMAQKDLIQRETYGTQNNKESTTLLPLNSSSNTAEGTNSFVLLMLQS